MKLVLTVTGYQGLPPGQGLRAEFGERGGSIGRAPDNDWILPDPERYLSAHHARIDSRHGEFHLTDVSTNGVYLNRQPRPVGRGNSVRLNDGDVISLGEYEITAGVEESRQAQEKDELALEPTPFPERAIGSSAQEMPGSSGEDLLPEDLSLDELLAPQSGPYPGTEESPRAGEIGSVPDHLPSDREFFRAPGATPESIPDDWDVELGASVPRPPPASLEQPVTTDGTAPEEMPEVPAPPPPAAVQPPPSPPREAALHGTEEQALAALLEGAGLGRDVAPAQASSELLRAAGQTLRACVEGMIAVLQARASFKSEFRMSQTTLRPVENNPLKFSVDADEALLRLLFPRGHGYMDPVTALRQGFKDLEAHQVALIAGMQAALRALLTRFAPQALEQRFASRSVLDALLPASRKARYWELFNETYQELVRDAEEDFQRLLGEEFARAYEEQARRLSLGNHEER